MGASIGIPQIFASFIAGVFTFISPCVFPIIPSYMAFITGKSYEDLTDESKASEIRKTTFLHSVMFVLGFTIIFTALGATATVIGGFLREHMDIILKIAGVTVFFFGLHLSGLVKINFLMQEHRMEVKNKPAGYLGSLAVGLAFGAGWTPCVGPLLGTALALASTNDTVTAGILLLGAFALGLGIPFILASLAFNSFMAYSVKFRKYMSKITVVGGVFLMIIGITLFMGWFGIISTWLVEKIPIRVQ